MGGRRRHCPFSYHLDGQGVWQLPWHNAWQYKRDRANRPTQHTFTCVVCGYEDPVDHKTAGTLAGHWGDWELAVCRDKKEIKALLLSRQEAWKQENEQRIERAGPSIQLRPGSLPYSFRQFRTDRPDAPEALLDTS